MFRNRCYDMGGRDQFMYKESQFNMNNEEFNASQSQFVAKDNGNGNKMMNEDNNCDFKGVVCPPVYECPQERCCHRQIHHEVEHVIPVNTRIINHHIYHHTYVPCYTCCEENDVCNVVDNKCCL